MILRLLNLSQDVLVGEQQVLLVTDLDGGTTVIRQQNLVTNSHGHGDDVTSVVVRNTGTSSNNSSLRQLLLVLLRDVQARSGLGGRLDSLNQNSVKEGLERRSGLQERHSDQWVTFSRS